MRIYTNHKGEVSYKLQQKLEDLLWLPLLLELHRGGLRAHIEMCIFHIYYWCTDVQSGTIVNPCLGSTAQRVCSAHEGLWWICTALITPSCFRRHQGVQNMSWLMEGSWPMMAERLWFRVYKDCGLCLFKTGSVHLGRICLSLVTPLKRGYIAFYKIAIAHHKRFWCWPHARVGHKPVIVSPLPTLPDRQNKEQKQLVQSYPVAGAKVRSSECKGSTLFTSPTLYRDMTTDLAAL